MKVARGQEKSKTGSSMRSHAKPREGQALADPRFKGFQAARRSGPLAFPSPWARSAQPPDGQPKYEDNRPPHLTYTGVPVAMEMEARSAGTPVAAYAVFASLLTGGPEAFVSVCKGPGQGCRSLPHGVSELGTPHFPLPLPSPPPFRAVGDPPHPFLNYPHSAYQQNPDWASPLLSILTHCPTPAWATFVSGLRRATAWGVSLCSSQAFCYKASRIF